MRNVIPNRYNYTGYFDSVKTCQNRTTDLAMSFALDLREYKDSSNNFVIKELAIVSTDV